ncbi:hypothetical protein EON79_22385, partial [bacterium]
MSDPNETSGETESTKNHGFDLLSIIDRTNEVVGEEKFDPTCIEGIDFLRLFVRQEHWLGRTMSRGEMAEFVQRAVAANDGQGLLRLVAEQELVLIQAADGLLFVSWDGEGDPVREVYNRHGGSLSIRSVFAGAQGAAERGSKLQDRAVDAILALKEDESYIEPGRGPCVNGDSEHDAEDGYGFHE